MVRHPIVAGQFYDSSNQACADALEVYLATDDQINPLSQSVGAIVPHAGWVCSGRTTGKTLSRMTAQPAPDTVVLLGAVHRLRLQKCAVFNTGKWVTPMGEALIDQQLAEALLRDQQDCETNCEAHDTEHSIEVQLPFIQRCFPHARILPIMVPAAPLACSFGSHLGRTLRQVDRRCLIIGTTDLTHYGPAYGMTEHGTGQRGLDWAKQVNDQRMLELLLSMKADEIVAEAIEHRNACGPGAAAATVAACTALGATSAALIEHTTSQETLSKLGRATMTDAVGYAGILYGMKRE